MKEHEIYMMNKVLENMFGKSIEQRFKEIEVEVEEVRAKRQAEIDAQMKSKGKGVEGEVLLEDNANDEVDDEEDDDEEDEDDDKVDDADDGGTGVKVSEASKEQTIDDYMHDDANEYHESAESEGENVDDKNVDEAEKLILRIAPEVEEGEIRHAYTLDEVLKI
ncbi:hypothetical protein Hanom_Chr10g00900721 [Helianthus anomalus]